MLKDIVFAELMFNSESRHLPDGTWILYFPKIEKAFIQLGHTYKWLTASSIEDAERCFYMDLDPLMYA